MGRPLEATVNHRTGSVLFVLTDKDFVMKGGIMK